MPGSLGPDETLDPILRGLVQVLQRRRGYRFSLDAVLLAQFAARTPAEQAVDLGTGSGVVALLLAALGGARRVTGLELQPGLAALARRSVALNGLEERVAIVEGDLRDSRALPRQGFDLVLSNPPFRPADRGDRSPDPERALARHEIAATLADVARAAKRLVRSNGRVCLIYPAARMAETFHALGAAGLCPRVLRIVHPRAAEPAELFLVESRPAKAGPLVVQPPLVVFEADGRYTAELRRMLRLD
jgi:tRNA1Val (adenine37-N6)-methyltransferase